MIGAPVFYPASPIQIRDETFERMKVVPGLNMIFKARTQPGQDDQMPYAVVWYTGERTQPSGDPNVGAPTFFHTLTLVVDILARAADEDILDCGIVTLVETARATLLTDPTWIMLFEGIERIDTRYAYPKEAADVVVQAIIEMEVTFRSEWPPYVPNDLKTIDVSVQPRAPSAACRSCSWINTPSGTSCSMCGAPLPITDITLEIDLEPPTCPSKPC